MWHDFFRAGGFGMYPTVVFGCALLAYSARFALHAERRLLPPVVAFGLLTIGSGLLGCSVGVIKTFRYLEQVPEHEQVMIGALGCAESLNNVVLALLIGMMAALIAAVAAVRISRRDDAAVPTA